MPSALWGDGLAASEAILLTTQEHQESEMASRGPERHLLAGHAGGSLSALQRQVPLS